MSLLFGYLQWNMFDKLNRKTKARSKKGRVPVPMCVKKKKKTKIKKIIYEGILTMHRKFLKRNTQLFTVIISEE